MADKPKPVTTPPKPRTPPSPDIQALARIDRILATLPGPVAARTIEFLSAKYNPVTYTAPLEADRGQQ